MFWEVVLKVRSEMDSNGNIFQQYPTNNEEVGDQRVVEKIIRSRGVHGSVWSDFGRNHGPN